MAATFLRANGTPSSAGALLLVGAHGPLATALICVIGFVGILTLGLSCPRGTRLFSRRSVVEPAHIQHGAEGIAEHNWRPGQQCFGMSEDDEAEFFTGSLAPRGAPPPSSAGGFYGRNAVAGGATRVSEAEKSSPEVVCRTLNEAKQSLLQATQLQQMQQLQPQQQQHDHQQQQHAKQDKHQQHRGASASIVPASGLNGKGATEMRCGPGSSAFAFGGATRRMPAAHQHAPLPRRGWHLGGRGHNTHTALHPSRLFQAPLARLSASGSSSSFSSKAHPLNVRATSHHTSAMTHRKSAMPPPQTRPHPNALGNSRVATEVNCGLTAEGASWSELAEALQGDPDAWRALLSSLADSKKVLNTHLRSKCEVCALPQAQCQHEPPDAPRTCTAGLALRKQVFRKLLMQVTVLCKELAETSLSADGGSTEDRASFTKSSSAGTLHLSGANRAIAAAPPPSSPVAKRSRHEVAAAAQASSGGCSVVPPLLVHAAPKQPQARVHAVVATQVQGRDEQSTAPSHSPSANDAIGLGIGMQ